MGKIAVSQARIEANRKNAQKSTGPKTEAGKARSRQNSLVHGLAGEGAVLPDGELQAVKERGTWLISALKPLNAFEMDLVETMAFEAVRLDRCRIEERVARGLRAREADACWVEMKKAEAAKLGRGLADRPEEIASKLASSAAGCDWLIVRWKALGKGIDKNGDWTEDQRSLALDMLGVPPEIRDLDTPLDLPEGMDSASHLREIVEHQLDTLRERKQDWLDAADDNRREAAVMGLLATDDPALVLLRRYETACARRQRQALDMLHKGRQRAEPIQTSSRNYVERVRDTTSVWAGPQRDPAPTPSRPDPDGPHSGGDGDKGSGPPPAAEMTPSQRARAAHAHFVPPANPGPMQERTHLMGRLRRLAAILAARTASQQRPIPRIRPQSSRIRPISTPTRPERSALLRLIDAPAA